MFRLHRGKGTCLFVQRHVSGEGSEASDGERAHKDLMHTKAEHDDVSKLRKTELSEDDGRLALHSHDNNLPDFR